MLWWTLPLFLIVAVSLDYSLSKFKDIVTGTMEEKLSLVLLGPVIAPLVEELAFRWLPLKYFGLEGMVIFLGVWLFMHYIWVFASDHFKVRHLIFYTVMGVYFCYLWYVGMGWLAILIHSLYNTVFCIVAVRREPELANWDFRNPSIARVAWNSKEIEMYRSWIRRLRR